MAQDRFDIARLVPSQVPGFVRSDYQTFLLFVQAYYEYLKESGTLVDMDTIRDIDVSIEKYIEHIKNEIAPKIPFKISENRFSATRLRDLYDAKGSASSFKLLFRLLYNEETDVVYPSQQMLIPSDGRWEQPTSIFVKFSTIIGDPFELQHKILILKGFGQFIEVLVERVERVLVIINGIAQYSPDVFQIFINRKYTGTIAVGQDVSHISNSVTLIGQVQICSAKIKVQKPGKNFKVGEIYQINTETGFGASIKVEKVDTNGGITQARLINAGVGYTSTFTTTLLSYSNRAIGIPTAFNSEFDGTNYSVTLNDTTDPLNDFGGFYEYDYTTDLDYWPTDYTTLLLRTFFDAGQTTSVEADLPAFILIEAGPLVKYPGYFSSNAGFLSDAYYIQDSEYYQIFSYVVKLNQALDNYGGVLKALLHPAGTALFGEYVLRDEIQITISSE
jgi:hypothetical protein